MAADSPPANGATPAIPTQSEVGGHGLMRSHNLKERERKVVPLHFEPKKVSLHFESKSSWRCIMNTHFVFWICVAAEHLFGSIFIVVQSEEIASFILFRHHHAETVSNQGIGKVL